MNNCTIGLNFHYSLFIIPYSFIYVYALQYSYASEKTIYSH